LSLGIGVSRGRPGLLTVYRRGVGAKMIKVDERTHARLAALAAESGTTIGGYVAKLVNATRTHAEWAAVAAQTEDYLREHFGFVATPEERAEFEAQHAAVQSGQPVRRTGRASA
jgi:hypothetical protein